MMRIAHERAESYILTLDIARAIQFLRMIWVGLEEVEKYIQKFILKN
jgi:hypothetical protein